MAIITPIPLEQVLSVDEDLECFHDNEYIAGMCGRCGQSTVDFCPTCFSYILNNCVNADEQVDAFGDRYIMFKCSHCSYQFTAEMV